MKYKGAVISDLHIGAFDVEKQYEEFINIFIKKIENKNLDFIIVCGDFFDHKLYLNDKNSIYAYKMIQRLSNINTNTKIRFVYGTESHECNQYNLLPITDIKSDIRVIKNVEEEELLEDLHILYLPEEYVYNKDRYYKDYFNKTYDYVFGHGVIREVMKEVPIKESKDTKRAKVPIFNTSELDKICRGEVYFGHYHINREINDIISVGSFSRWKFGEEDRKGFYFIDCDTNEKIYNREFIENTLSDTFITINFGYDSEIFKDSNKLEQTLDKCTSLLTNDSIDHIRFQLNVPTDAKEPEAIINYIKERYKYNDNVKINLVNGYISEKKEQNEKEIKEENDKYGFIEEDIPIEEKISTYIRIEKNKIIDPNNILIYLTNSVEEILDKINN